MNVRGERIIVFGDSLSHHGADAAPEIWDVDQGSQRISGQPGDLLASMLLEQGAQAVRVNARVGRSAHNFFGRENHQALLGSDAAFRPTKVIVILGTNDIGLNLAVDREAMTKIRDFYKSIGAEVWAIGPFAYTSAALNQQAVPVVDMMKDAFGQRFIDPRPVTATVGRAGDGVHFGGESARLTAQGLLPLVLSATAFPWKPLLVGVAAVLGGAIAWGYFKRGKIELPTLSDGSSTPPTPREPGGAAEDWSWGSRRWRERMRRQGWKLPPESELRAIEVGQLEGPKFLDGYRVAYSTAAPAQQPDGSYVVRVVDERSLPTLAHAEKLRRSYNKQGYWAWVEDDDGNFVPVKGAKKPHPTYERWRKSRGETKGLDGYCNPNQSPEAFKRCVKRQKRAQLGGDDWKPPEDQIRERLFDDDPASMGVAEDIALQHNVKLSEWSSRNNRGAAAKNSGRFAVEPGYRKAEVNWKIGHSGHPENVGECHAIITGYVDERKVLWADDWPQEAGEGVTRAYGHKGTEDQCRRLAAQEAWAIAKELKVSLKAEPDEDFATDPAAARQKHAVQAFHRAFARRDVHKEPMELFGLRGDDWKPSEERFKELVASDDPEALNIAQDVLLQAGQRISQVTKTGGEAGLHTKAYFKLSLGEGRDLSWMVEQRGLGRCSAVFRASSGYDTGNARHERYYDGAGEQCERQAAGDAWAITKRLKKIAPTGSNGKWALNQSATIGMEMTRALDQDNCEPVELYGLGTRPPSPSDDASSLEQQALDMIRDSDDMLAVEDFMLEKNLRFGSASPLASKQEKKNYPHGIFYKTPTEGILRLSKYDQNPKNPATVLTWKIHRVHKSEGPWDGGGMDSFNVEYELNYTLGDGSTDRVRLEAGFPRRHESFDDVRREAAAEAWAMGKAVKQRLTKAPWISSGTMTKTMVNAMYDDGRDDLKRRPDLYGPKHKWTRKDAMRVIDAATGGDD